MKKFGTFENASDPEVARFCVNLHKENIVMPMIIILFLTILSLLNLERSPSSSWNNQNNRYILVFHFDIRNKIQNIKYVTNM